MVLGQTVAEQLFGDTDQMVTVGRIGRFMYQILGVLEAKGSGRGGRDRDDAMFVPFPTAQRLLERERSVNDIMCSASSPGVLPHAEAQAVALLRERHELEDDEPDDFELRTPRRCCRCGHAQSRR